MYKLLREIGLRKSTRLLIWIEFHKLLVHSKLTDQMLPNYSYAGHVVVAFSNIIIFFLFSHNHHHS